MNERSYRWLFWSLVLVGLSVDQATKYGVFHSLYHDGNGTFRKEDRPQLIPGAFELVTHFKGGESEDGPFLRRLQTLCGDEALPMVNEGALFGLGGTYRHWANRSFALISLIAAIAIVFWSTRKVMARDRTLCMALGLILAGTLGNLYDRLVFHGVRDFLYFYWHVDWPVFNVADCCLVCGAGLLLLQAFLAPAPQEEKQTATTANAEAPVAVTQQS